MSSIKNKWLSKACGTMLVIVTITILPSIFELIGAALFSRTHEFWNNCYANGQFLIYSISLIATTVATMHIQNQNIAGWLIILISVYCLTYAIINITISIIVPYLPNIKISINKTLLLVISVFGMIIGMLCCMYSQYKIQQLKVPDIKGIDDKGIEKLANHLEI